VDVYAAVDIRGGKCVRLMQGDFGRETVYMDDPVEAARHWQEQGADWLHVVDLDGARSGRRANAEPIRALLAGIDRTPVQVAGGIRTLDRARAVLDEGAARVVLGTAAVRNPSLLREAVAALPGRVAVGVDARDGEVKIEGWEQTSGQSLNRVADAAAQAGAATIIYTDISVDGTLSHPNVEATRALVERLAPGTPIIASGGVGSLNDIAQLRAAGVAGVIIGRALYTGALKLTDALAVAHAE
jgi:phosphoribosylformimino-5-aminoimidazole carboxamide ribotide isomerase